MYLAMFGLLIVLLFAMMSMDQPVSNLKYYQVLDYFRNGEVEEYQIDYNDGTLTLKLEGQDQLVDYQLASITRQLVNITKGVTYTRFVRKGIIKVYEDGSEFPIGKGVVLHESDHDAAAILTSGIMVDEALKAYEALQAEGISVRVIDLFTWKPLDEELVIKAARETGAIVTAENHNVTCGLGSVVANCLAKNAPTIQEFVGVQDRFGQVGPQDFLMDEYGLRSVNIVAAVKKVISRK